LLLIKPTPLSPSAVATRSPRPPRHRAGCAAQNRRQATTQPHLHPLSAAPRVAPHRTAPVLLQQRALSRHNEPSTTAARRVRINTYTKKHDVHRFPSKDFGTFRSLIAAHRIPCSFVLVSLISPSPHRGSRCTHSHYGTVTTVPSKVVVTLKYFVFFLKMETKTF